MRRLVGLVSKTATAATMVAGLVACGSGDMKSTTGTLPPTNPMTGSPIGSAGTGVLPPSSTGTNSNPSSTTPIGTMKPSTSTPTGTAGTGSTPSTTPTTSGSPMPCAVATVVSNNCQKCHAATPIGGAPMPLMTYDDFHKPAKTMPSMQVYQLAKMRINGTPTPMPPGGGLQGTPDFTTLDTWLGAGAMAGTDADKMCAAAMNMPPATLDTGDGTVGKITPAAGETCYEFKNHGSTTSVDDTKFTVPANGEEYVQFYFKIPWPKGAVATRYGTDFDNQQVLHHWLMFTSNEGYNDGYWEVRPLPTVAGTDATLLAGWAVGGTNLAMPDDAAFELPDPGGNLLINVQWHFYNYGTADAMDSSSAQVCTVPAGTRPHTATITWTGSEDLGGNKWLLGQGMPPHQVSVFTGTCNPWPQPQNANLMGPVHILGFWPHMHKLGTRMRSLVNHQGGMQNDPIFDKAFDFNHQIHYIQTYDLQPGDTLTTECTFNNTTDSGVAFGESTNDEMCYNFTMAWPAHSLENGVSSLIGASNTCWGD